MGVLTAQPSLLRGSCTPGAVGTMAAWAMVCLLYMSTAVGQGEVASAEKDGE